MPYYYLYDSQLQDRAFANQLIRLEHTLTDLGIQGKIGRLTLLKSVADLVENAIRDGADTVVAVGNDATFSRVAEVVAKNANVTLGFVPLGPGPHIMAELLGIPIGILSCHVVSSRLIEQINVGKINNHYFVQSVTLEGTPILQCTNYKHTFHLQLQAPHQIKICNIDWADKLHQRPSDPCHAALELTLQPEKKKTWLGKTAATRVSIIPIQQLMIDGGDEELPITIDGYRVAKTPAVISLAPTHLRVIVGKKRLVE